MFSDVFILLAIKNYSSTSYCTQAIKQNGYALTIVMH